MDDFNRVADGGFLPCATRTYFGSVPGLGVVYTVVLRDDEIAEFDAIAAKVGARDVSAERNAHRAEVAAKQDAYDPAIHAF
jgi:hypothetical protein